MNLDQVIWTPGVTLEMMELHICSAAFLHYHGNKSRTAVSLGITVRTLETKLELVEGMRKKAAEKMAKEKEDAERELHYARYGGRPQPTTQMSSSRPSEGGAPKAASAAPGMAPSGVAPNTARGDTEKHRAAPVRGRA